ncbi:MAG TPA: metallophosphoesterase [Clostridiales bacterium]|nr:metallophosphoesterase [Clostridiales bacterium]
MYDSAKRVFIFFVLFLFVGCDIFEYSPYDDDLETNIRDSNSKNISKINSILTETETDSFDYALISDTHSDYDYLHDAVKWINRHENIKFTLHLGDQSDSGLKFEFENTLNELNKLNNPFIVIIGNHDHLSQGKSIYNTIYGQTNFTFTIGSSKFIGFDNIVWENANNRPDFDWLQNELNSHNGNLFLLMHIPEGCMSMELYKEEYLSIINQINNLYRFHGHTHCLDDNWPKLITCAITEKMIPVVSVRNQNVSYKIESF